MPPTYQIVGILSTYSVGNAGKTWAFFYQGRKILLESTSIKENRKLLVISIGDMKISNDPSVTLITYALGSCIGIAAYDPDPRVGGILHYLLPRPPNEEKSRCRPLAYGCLAIPVFLRALLEAGAKKSNLVIKIAGGADMLDSKGAFRIGTSNFNMARSILRENSITIAGRDVGGFHGRTLRLRLKDGDVRVVHPLQKEVTL